MTLELVFTACDTCRAKPGSPPLCVGCLRNLMVIGSFNQASMKCAPRADGQEPRTKTWHRAREILNRPLTR
jgi:hypothetical protein